MDSWTEKIDQLGIADCVVERMGNFRISLKFWMWQSKRRIQVGTFFFNLSWKYPFYMNASIIQRAIRMDIRCLLLELWLWDPTCNRRNSKTTPDRKNTYISNFGNHLTSHTHKFSIWLVIGVNIIRRISLGRSARPWKK